eukprot:jgi/Bigna1/133992/aug1.23_g8700
MMVRHRFELLPERTIKSTKTGKKKGISRVNTSLAVTIKPPAALLSFDLQDLPTEMMHSEVSSTIVTVRNDGGLAVEGSSVQIKVSHPLFVVIATTTTGGEEGGEEEQVLSYNRKDGLISLPNGVIAPEAMIKLKIYVRGASVGVHCIRFLVRYCYIDVEKKQKHHRVVHIEHPLRVKPFMHLDIFRETADGGRGGMSINIHRAVLISDAFTILPSDISREESSLTLRPEESYNLVLRVHAKDKEEEEEEEGVELKGDRKKEAGGSSSSSSNDRGDAADDDDEKEQLLDDCKGAQLHYDSSGKKKFSVHNFLPPKGDDAVDRKESAIGAAVWQLLGMEGFLEEVELERKIALNPNAYKELSTTGQDTKKDFDLIVLWNSKKKSKRRRTAAVGAGTGGGDDDQKTKEAVASSSPLTTVAASGFFMIRNQKCLHSLYSKNKSACPLKVMVRHPELLQHDFTTKGRLFVPVDIQVCNRRDDISVSFVFETLPPNQEFDSVSRSFRESRNHSMAARYFWHGKTTQRVKQLGPNKKVLLQIHAAFHADGDYNLNRFRFSVDMPGIGIKHFFFPLQHLISIRSDGGTATTAPAASAKGGSKS